MAGVFASPWFVNAALFLLALGVSYALTPVWSRLALRLGIVAHPVGGRHIHTKATPLGGGVAVFLAFHLGMGAFMLAGKVRCGEFLLAGWPGFSLASLGLLAVGLVDDARNMRPVVKLAGQVAAALCVFFFSGIRLAHIGALSWMPVWLDGMATVFWITLVINAFNFTDGMDGVTAGLAAIISLGTAGAQFFLRNTADAAPYLALAGACLGFLRHNFHPASVFMGDTGSMFIGFALATLPLMTGTHSEFVPAAIFPFLIMGIPFFDTMVAIWRRVARTLLARAEKAVVGGVMSGDKDHVHHRALAYFADQRKAVWFLYGVNLLLAVAALSVLARKSRGTGLFIVVFMVITALVVRHLKAVELWDTGRLVLNRTAGRKWKRMRIPIYVLADLLAAAGAWTAAHGLLSQKINGETYRSGLFMALLLSMFILFGAFRLYNRMWTRARPHEFAAIPCAIALTGLVTLAVFYLFGLHHEDGGPKTVIFCVVVCWPVLGFRMFSSFLRDYMGVLHDRRHREDAARVIVLGCGGRFELYVHEQNRRTEERRRVIAGLLDDDPLLKGRLVAGLRVFGPLEALPLLVGKTGAGELIVTPKLGPGRREEVLRAAKKTNCRV
ncbi:MAG: hypothetical protein FWF96_07285, partial [Kiritimatiellaeota bacterium]|nr:hypothetical protein [Kiritimatiellota bacterium]